MLVEFPMLLAQDLEAQLRPRYRQDSRHVTALCICDGLLLVISP